MGISTEAMNYVLKQKTGSLLDIGCGRAIHSRHFAKAGWEVHGIDILPEGEQPPGVFHRYWEGFWQEYVERPQFDCVWASHVLEHQTDIGRFLIFCRENLKEGGLLAITVPPLKHSIVGGHVSLWNMGLLFYNLILAGFNCVEARGLKYGYNISVVVPLKTIEKLPELHYDRGDIELLAPFFPKGHAWKQSFNGDLTNINWR